MDVGENCVVFFFSLLILLLPFVFRTWMKPLPCLVPRVIHLSQHLKNAWRLLMPSLSQKCSSCLTPILCHHHLSKWLDIFKVLFLFFFPKSHVVVYRKTNGRKVLLCALMSADRILTLLCWVLVLNIVEINASLFPVFVFEPLVIRIICHMYQDPVLRYLWN